MELLLVTSSWPLATAAEFLENEILHLAAKFDRVVVAPMRPHGSMVTGLPPTVTVDLSLANHLERTRLLPTTSSRILTAALRVARPNPVGFGLSRDSWRDMGRVSWLRSALLSRADVASVAGWAAGRCTPGIAYTFWLGASTVGLRAAWPNIPLVSRVHGGDLYAEAHGWATIPYQDQALAGTTMIASVSESGRTYLVDKFPDYPNKVVVRRLGTRDLGGLAVSSSVEPLSILSVSSIDDNKRVDLIADVASFLATSGRLVSWTHIGDGPGKSKLLAKLSGKPSKLSVSLRGHLPLEEVHRELLRGNHHVFVNLSLSEGVPVSLMEAQCVGLPVVATAVGGTPEVALARWNELVEPSDPVPVIAAAAIRASERAQSERTERHTHWERNFNANTVYASWATELRRLAGDGDGD